MAKISAEKRCPTTSPIMAPISECPGTASKMLPPSIAAHHHFILTISIFTLTHQGKGLSSPNHAFPIELITTKNGSKQFDRIETEHRETTTCHRWGLIE